MDFSDDWSITIFRDKDGKIQFKEDPIIFKNTDEDGWFHICIDRRDTEFKTFINGLLYRTEYRSRSWLYNFIKNIPIKIRYHYYRYRIKCGKDQLYG